MSMRDQILHMRFPGSERPPDCGKADSIHAPHCGRLGLWCRPALCVTAAFGRYLDKVS